MSTTINRQLSLLVEGIVFGKHKMEDRLDLVADLVSALQRMWTEGGKDPAKLSVIREEILSAMLGGGRVENEKAEMEGRVQACLGITINGSSRFDAVLKFLLKKDKEGQPVEKYGRWCKENPYDAPKPFQIAKTPDLLVMTWEMAFQSQTDKHADLRPELVRFTGGEDVPNAVPNPYQRPAILRQPTSVDSD